MLCFLGRAWRAHFFFTTKTWDRTLKFLQTRLAKPKPGRARFVSVPWVTNHRDFDRRTSLAHARFLVLLVSVCWGPIRFFRPRRLFGPNQQPYRVKQQACGGLEKQGPHGFPAFRGLMVAWSCPSAAAVVGYMLSPGELGCRAAQSRFLLAICAMVKKSMQRLLWTMSMPLYTML